MNIQITMVAVRIHSIKTIKDGARFKIINLKTDIDKQKRVLYSNFIAIIAFYLPDVWIFSKLPYWLWESNSD